MRNLGKSSFQKWSHGQFKNNAVCSEMIKIKEQKLPVCCTEALNSCSYFFSACSSCVIPQATALMDSKLYEDMRRFLREMVILQLKTSITSHL